MFTFVRPVTKLAELKEAVATYASRAAERLRRQGSVASSMQTFIETSRFNNDPWSSNEITIQLDQPTAYTPELVRVATASMERIFRSNFNYKRAGVMLIGICPDNKMQRGFWGREYSERDKRVMVVVDQINSRFGKDTIKGAASGLKQCWQMRSEMRSPRYTTSWEDLPTVLAR
ncbi:MAG: DUF4113 domain-containing protein [Acidobacteriota bacterium]